MVHQEKKKAGILFFLFFLLEKSFIVQNLQFKIGFYHV